MKNPAITKATQDLKSELEKSAQALRELREEVRVRLHLGALDVKDEWQRLDHVSKPPWSGPEGTSPMPPGPPSSR